MRVFDKISFKNIDWWLVVCYLLLCVIGLLNIYASIHSSESLSFFDFAGRSGKQFFWFGISLIFAFLILLSINPHVYEELSLIFYLIIGVLLIAVIFLGTPIKGSHSWFRFGEIAFQPAELSKITTSLLLAAYMSHYGFRMGRLSNFVLASLIVLLPMMVIVLQSETGSALVYLGFIFVFYREGLSGWIVFMFGLTIALFILTLMVSPYAAILALAVVVSFCDALNCGKMRNWLLVYLPCFIVLGALPYLFPLLEKLPASIYSVIKIVRPIYILMAACVIAIPFILVKAYRLRKTFTFIAVAGFVVGVMLVFSTQFIFYNVLKDHQRDRVEVLLGMKEDPAGVGYNVNQSMIAIGSGGLSGKGWLNGTQTTFGFVPEQSTDFIFCTIGEEWGFIGSALVILVYVFLISRIIIGAERSTEPFTRIYGYCVASCFFMHLFINIGMAIGLMPVIGIPLPLISYGGSSLLTFTILLFIFAALKRNDN